jgi:hypothetical protein
MGSLLTQQENLFVRAQQKEKALSRQNHTQSFIDYKSVLGCSLNFTLRSASALVGAA